jgi:MarR family transcriptional regulator, transcriptional regulator for hemolysin
VSAGKLLDVDSSRLPIGLQLTRTARVISRAYDEALAAADGSLPVWLVLMNVKIRAGANQRELAVAVGIREATLTHHLNAMEARGLITRARDPGNRRTHLVTLTAAGEAAFRRLRDATIAFDQRLRHEISEERLAIVAAVFTQLLENVGGTEDDLTPVLGTDGHPGQRGRACEAPDR